MLNISLIQIQYLIALDEHRNFIKAAEACFVTQPTLSMQMKKLEDELGVLIFDRSKQPIVPTSIGSKIIHQARTIYRETGQIENILRDFTGDISGSLKIGVLPTIANALIPKLVREVSENHPDLKLTIKEGLTHEIIEDLEHDRLDVGIVSTPVKHNGLVERNLYNEKFRIYALIKDKDDNILDVSSSEIFQTMKPGEVFEFKMLASPHISQDVDYYSCFAFGDDSIMPLTAKQNDETFTFRYTANAWFKDAEFTDDGTELNMYSTNGFQLPVVGSFEFPTNSINEKYEVILDGEKMAKGASAKDPKIKFTESVETLQSIDEMGNWHLYFEVPEAFQGNVKISGFMENDGTVAVPDEIDLTTLIYYEIEGGEVLDITAMPKKASLVINMDSTDDGELSLKINDFLVRPFDNGEFIAQIHSEPGLFSDETETLYITDEFGFEKGLTITIPFKKGTEKIEIFGSYVVPEFGQMVMIVLAVTIIGIVIISRKTNSFSNLFYTKM